MSRGLATKEQLGWHHLYGSEKASTNAITKKHVSYICT